MKFSSQNKTLIIILMLVVVAIGGYFWYSTRDQGPGDGFISGNGRLEATEIDISTKLAGRIDDILVNEGDFVTTGQPLAHMQIQVLEAQHAEATAQYYQAVNAEESAKAQIKLKESDVLAAQAVVVQRESELDAAQKRLARSETLAKTQALSYQQLDDDRASVKSAEAAVLAAKAQVAAAEAAVDAAKAQAVGAASTVKAAQATIDRVQADIEDSQLIAPRDGRIQYRVSQPGEVLGAGGKVLNMVDLSDVYMTFFLPEVAVGKVSIGGEAHIILDAAPQYVIPAKITFVASTAQFTPKTVETASERQKLMFRVKAQIDKELLQKHLELVKTGLPGVAWVKLDPDAEWPANLAVNVSL
ncbi:HlyD family secretion protein [Zophobihabitans entericus]|uniref:HlyD family efflux transporter periplasmic adaptor subunit n=1 Tax=Zophobihabitans entericus TaxID=1635327 RepID=A0A6G9IBF0_9GAMM|nr:HlyD family efflux transporter periplasmic adaptor subunit [Zophobihabitans entericus]QIQ21558.1 HlyD family efflux transporter periplasmic adaptor subunit [Zophobihabitans entericus]